MCGIAGIISQNPNNVSITKLKQMTDIISHRGPDGEGQWVAENGKVGFGHRRLSILDLSEAGKQPMHYLNSRYTITFNGEIYNYIELRDGLLKKGYHFVSDSDTEVLMAMYDYKKEKCLEDLDGMFAFAIWDNKEQTIFIARDRFGEKPLYYHIKDNTFYFASEMKALWAVGVEKDLNHRMTFNYWFYNQLYNPDDLSETFYKEIHAVKPSHYLLINCNAQIEKYQKYWDIDYTLCDDAISYQSAIGKFQQLFYGSVEKRLRSDVSIGSSLSGGLDSSSIVCAINKLNGNSSNQNTFSACFPNYIKDESIYIDKVLARINTKGYKCMPDASSFIENLDDVIYFHDEPLGSASVCIQYEVMKLAKEKGTIVILDGQGADEILCGYDGLVGTFFYEQKKTNKAVYKEEMGQYLSLQKGNVINPIKKIRRHHIIKEYLTSTQINGLLGFKTSCSEFFSPTVKREFYETYKKDQFNVKHQFGSLNEALYYLTMSGGLQELLRYADRNSMAHSRETRLPFLSHQLVEFLFSLPPTFKFKHGYTKSILRDSMNDVLPHEIAWRKDKIGYAPPQSEWMLDNRVQNKLKLDKTKVQFSSGDRLTWKSLIMNNL
jgi:asparagine synthase (glutamine-hydrolysing)